MLRIGMNLRDVMDEGGELYERPATSAAGPFLSKTNFVDGFELALDGDGA